MYYNYPFKYQGVTNVQHNFNYYFDMLTNKCCNLFQWEGLPDTIDERALNLDLVLSGKVCWTKFNGELYALTGNVGGEPNVYYEPQEFIIANPILGSKNVKIRHRDGSQTVEGLDGILMANSDVDQMSDRTSGGLFGLIYQYAGLLADNISSLNISQINGRVSQIWTADEQSLGKTAELIIKDIYEGKPYKIITQDMIDKVGVLPAAQTGQSNTLLNLMELHTFFLGQFYNELGIGFQSNLKRERINEAEIGLMKGQLDINIYNMLKNREQALEQINELFGTNISVELRPEIFYYGSGNATLGEEPEVLPEEEVGEVGEAEMIEEEKEVPIEEEEKKAEVNKNESD